MGIGSDLYMYDVVVSQSLGLVLKNWNTCTQNFTRYVCGPQNWKGSYDPDHASLGVVCPP